jgi:putative ABC transport system substrate-binding protein
LTVELNGKRLELLKDTLPSIQRVAVLGNPGHPAYRTQIREAEAAAKALRLQVQFLEARGADEFESAFASFRQSGAQALLVSADPIFYASRSRMVDLAAKRNVPAMYEFKEFVEVGGLMSYGTNIFELYRYLARFVDRILRGAILPICR